jgi:hypothetical protein
MRLKVWVVGVAASGLGVAAPAQAQYPEQYPGYGGAPSYQTPYPYAPPPPGTYLPNYYNRQNQPLSPYMNLFRTNPAVNYFYGVRPGTQGGGVPVGGGFGAGAYGGMMRPNVLPTTLTPTEEPIPVDPAGTPISRLMPTGHPVFFAGGPGRPGGGVGRPGFTRTGTGSTAPPTTRPGTGAARPPG